MNREISLFNFISDIKTFIQQEETAICLSLIEIKPIRKTQKPTLLLTRRLQSLDDKRKMEKKKKNVNNRCKTSLLVIDNFTNDNDTKIVIRRKKTVKIKGYYYWLCVKFFFYKTPLEYVLFMVYIKSTTYQEIKKDQEVHIVFTMVWLCWDFPSNILIFPVVFFCLWPSFKSLKWCYSR